MERLISSLTKAQNEILITRMRFRDDHAANILLSSIRDPGRVWQAISKLLNNVTQRLSRHATEIRAVLPYFIVGLFVGIWLRSKLPSTATTTKPGFGDALLLVLRRYAVALVPLLFSSLYFSIGAYQAGDYTSIGLLFLFFSAYVISLLLIDFLLRPTSGYVRVLTLRKRIAMPMARSLRVLATLTLLGAIVYSFLRAEDVPSALLDMARLVSVTVFALNLLLVFFLMSRARAISTPSRWLCYGLSFLSIVAVIAEWSGFLNLGEYLIVGVLGTALAGVILWLLSQFSREVFDGLDLGTRDWHQRIRRRLAIEQGEHIPGLVWFRLISTIVVWGLVTVILLRAWGLSLAGFVLLRRYIFDGFQIGDFTVVPIKIAFRNLFVWLDPRAFSIVESAARSPLSSIVKNGTKLTRNLGHYYRVSRFHDRAVDRSITRWDRFSKSRHCRGRTLTWDRFRFTKYRK